MSAPRAPLLRVSSLFTNSLDAHQVHICLSPLTTTQSMPSYVDIAGWVDSTTGATSRPVARGCKRTRALVEMDANATATTPKRLRIGKPTAPAAVIGVQSENAGLDDIEDTPRAPRSSSALPLLSNAPALGRPPSTSSSKRSCSENEENSSRRSGQSGSSKRSKRSGSPLKQSSDRQYGLYPIIYAAGDMNIPSKLPKAVEGLVKPLKGIARDIAVLPLAYDTPAMREAVGGVDMEETLFHDHAAGDAVPALEEVSELVEKTPSTQPRLHSPFLPWPVHHEVDGGLVCHLYFRLCCVRSACRTRLHHIG